MILIFLKIFLINFKNFLISPQINVVSRQTQPCNLRLHILSFILSVKRKSVLSCFLFKIILILYLQYSPMLMIRKNRLNYQYQRLSNSFVIYFFSLFSKYPMLSWFIVCRCLTFCAHVFNPVSSVMDVIMISDVWDFCALSGTKYRIFFLLKL